MSGDEDGDRDFGPDGGWWPPCGMCGGEGELDAYDLDPLYYQPGDTVTCPQCGGRGDYTFMAGSQQ